MNKSIKIGIIGCGKRMADFIETLKSEDKNDVCEIAAITDVNEESINNFKTKFKKEFIIYQSVEEMMKNTDLSWIFIGSYNKFHKEHIAISLNHNKNVFCEKPLAINLKECIEIKNLLKTKDKHLVIGYVLRYSPYYLKIKELIDSKEIGKIVSLEFNETIPHMHGAFFMSNWRRFSEHSGGFLLEKCCHDIDIANWLVGSIPRKVASFGGLTTFRKENYQILEKIEKENKLRIKEGKKIPSCYTWRENPFETDKEIVDHQVVIIKYFNHVCATFHTNCTSAIPERRMYITGTEGSIRGDLLTGKIELKKLGEELVEIFPFGVEKIEKTKLDSHGEGDKFLAKSLIETMAFNSPSPVSMNEAIKSTISSFAIEKSLRLSKTLVLEKFWYKIGEIPFASVEKAQKTDPMKDVKVKESI